MCGSGLCAGRRLWWCIFEETVHGSRCTVYGESSDRIYRIDRVYGKRCTAQGAQEKMLGLIEFVGLKDGPKTSSLLWAIVFSMALCLMSAGCSGPVGQEAVLNDFETDADLDRVHWQCRTLFSLSSEHVTSGEHSLKMELFPADYPGLALKLDEHDWSRFGNVVFDIFNPQNETLVLTVRIDDRPDYPDYEERYNGRHTLQPGSNHLSIPLNSLRTSGSGRPLNLKAIRRFLFFLADTRETYRLYVDNIRLAK